MENKLVKRYYISRDGEMVEDPMGYWMIYGDYESQQKEIARLKEELKTYIGMYDNQLKHSKITAEENTKLKERDVFMTKELDAWEKRNNELRERVKELEEVECKHKSGLRYTGEGTQCLSCDKWLNF